MTQKFVSAAELMARVLGAEGFQFVTTDHPFSSANNEELTRRARLGGQQGPGMLLGMRP